MNLKRMLTTDDVALWFGVSPQRVRVWLASGALKGTRAGKRWLVDPRDAERFRPGPTGYPKGKPRPRPEKGDGGA